MKEFINRFLAETPTFFKRIIAIGVALGGIGAGLMEPHIADAVPWAAKYASHLIGIGAIAALVAKFAVNNPQDINGPKP